MSQNAIIVNDSLIIICLMIRKVMNFKKIALIQGFICSLAAVFIYLIPKEAKSIASQVKTYVVIGSSAAGRGAVKELTKKALPNDHIILISKQEFYDKTRLKKYIKKNRLPLLSCPVQKKAPIRVIHDEVISVKRHTKEVICKNGTIISYDCLFLGIGAEPITPTIKGMNEVYGIFGYYNLANVRAIKQYIESHQVKSIAVIGSGLASLEITAALTAQGYQVHHCVRGQRILKDKADDNGAQHIQNIFKKNGVQWHFNTEITQVKSVNNHITEIILNNQDEMPIDMMIYAIGSTVNTHLVEWLNTRQGAFSVDSYMRTNDPFIYTGGDAACVWDYVNECFTRSGKWTLAEEQGCCAAKNMCGQKTPYEGVACVNFAQYFKTLVAFSGPVNNPPLNYTYTSHASKSWLLKITDSFLETKDGYRIFLKKNGLLKGFCLVDVTFREILNYKQALNKK